MGRASYMYCHLMTCWGLRKQLPKACVLAKLPNNGTDFSSISRGELSSKECEVSLPFHEGVGFGGAGHLKSPL